MLISVSNLQEIIKLLPRLSMTSMHLQYTSVFKIRVFFQNPTELNQIFNWKKTKTTYGSNQKIVVACRIFTTTEAQQHNAQLIFILSCIFFWLSVKMTTHGKYVGEGNGWMSFPLIDKHFSSMNSYTTSTFDAGKSFIEECAGKAVATFVSQHTQNRFNPSKTLKWNCLLLFVSKFAGSN